MRRIEQLTTALVVAAVLVGLSATDGFAQANGGTDGDVVAPTWNILPADAQAHLTLGDSLVGEGEYGRGRTEYESAADLIRAEGSFPSVALRRIADSYYFQGKYRRAIAALDQLAREASEVGDIVTQAWALADAAWIHWKDSTQRHRPGAVMEMDSRLNRLQRLLVSPYLPDEVRAQIQAKRCGGPDAN